MRGADAGVFPGKEEGFRLTADRDRLSNEC